MIDNIRFGGRTLDELLLGPSTWVALVEHGQPKTTIGTWWPVDPHHDQDVCRVFRNQAARDRAKDVLVIRRPWGTNGQARPRNSGMLWYVLDQRGSRIRFVATTHEAAIRVADALAAGRIGR